MSERGQVIPAEAVEAAAKAVWYGGTAPGCGYGDIPAAARSTLEKDVREILEAAAPHMLKDLRELVEDMEAQPPSEIGSVRGMGGIIRATMKGML